LSYDCDVAVGGGSVAGLAFAREAARRGVSVVVLEEHVEVGEPEKCDGLVSLRGLRRYGFMPRDGVIQNQILSGVVHSPSGKSFPVNSSTMEVVVLDRSEFDKQLCEEAQEAGARVLTGKRVSGVSEDAKGVSVEAGGEVVRGRYYVDATGPASSPKEGIMPAAKFEVEGDWIRSSAVEVFVDASLYPGFFAWVIPTGRGAAKVGAAGRGVNPFRALESFLSTRPCKVLRRVSAPIYVGGPTKEFVAGRRVFVGESAGQVKPTTAGGIVTSIAGAAFAARRVAECLKSGDPSKLSRYRQDWGDEYMREMRTMSALRGVYEKLNNLDLEAIVETLATPRLILALSRADFDFHASALLGAIGFPGLLGVAKVVAVAEMRSAVAGR
jgi:digeranylgeranylglycerophospholipid reductase